MITYYVTAIGVNSTNIEELETNLEISENELLKLCRSFVESCYLKNDSYPRYLIVGKTDLDLVIKTHKCYWLNFSETSFWLETVSSERLNEIVLNPNWLSNLFNKVNL
jgi:hypothetical protein